MASDTLLVIITNLVFLAGTVTMLVVLQSVLFQLSVLLLPSSARILHCCQSLGSEASVEARA